MGIEDCCWRAADVLNVVDGAELVLVARNKYLCVWHGGRFVEFYDLTSDELPDTQTISLAVPLTLLFVHDTIDDYFNALDFDIENKDLTTPLRGAIVNTESGNTTEEN